MKKVFFCVYILLLGYSNLLSQVQSDSAGKIRAVYFFGPSATESDTINENDAAALDDFNYYTSLAIPFIEQNNLKVEYTSERSIKIPYNSDRFFIVCRDSVDFGTILSDGVNPPKILKYVLTDDQLKDEVKAYFKLK